MTERPPADIESHIWVRIHSGAYRSDEDLRTYAMNVIGAVGRALAPVLIR
jgi:phytoene/squalene synthetase